MTNEFLDDDTQPGYPLIPQTNDPRWQTCIVHLTSAESIHLCSFPREIKNYPVASIRNNDTIAILPDIRFGDWVAARNEHRSGWLDLRSVELTPVRHQLLSLDDTDEDTQDMHMAGMILSRMRTKGLRRAERSVELSEREIERIERYMRGIALTLKMARKRSKFRQE